MSLTVTAIPDRHDRTGAKILKYVTIVGPTSYATGGESIPPSAFGLNRVELLLAEDASNDTDLRRVRYDYANGKVKWFDYAGAEIAALTNLSTYSARAVAIGV